MEDNKKIIRDVENLRGEIRALGAILFQIVDLIGDIIEERNDSRP